MKRYEGIDSKYSVSHYDTDVAEFKTLSVLVSVDSTNK